MTRAGWAWGVGGLLVVGVVAVGLVRHTAEVARQRNQARALLRLADQTMQEVVARSAGRKDLLAAVKGYYDAVLAQPAGDIEVSLAQAQARLGLAQVVAETVGRREALAECELAREQFAAHPNAPEFRAGLAATDAVTAQLQAQLEMPAEAEASLRQALEVRQELSDKRALAATLVAMGSLVREQGRPEDAGRFYRQAQELYEELREPTTILFLRGSVAAETGKLKEAEGFFEQGQAREALGRLYRDTGRPGLAEKAFQEAARQGSADQRARAKRSLAGLLFDLGRAKEGEAQLLEAMELARRAGEPDGVEAIQQAAVEWTFLAQLHRGQPRYQEAAQALWQRLAALPVPDGELRMARAGRLTAQGNALVALGNVAKAVPAYAEALGLLEQQVKAYPDVPRYRQTLVAVQTAQALAHARQQKPAEAVGFLQQAAAGGEKLVADAPQVIDYGVTLANTLQTLGDLTRAKPDVALGWYGKAAARLEALAKAVPTYTPVRGALALTLGRRGELALASDRPKEALADLDRAIALEKPRERIDYRVSRAACLANLGDTATATKDAEELAKGKRTGVELYNLACVWGVCLRGVAKLPAEQRKGKDAEYTAKAVALLGRARQEGYFKQPQVVEHMKKDADLEALRQTAEYRKFLAEVEAKEATPP